MCVVCAIFLSIIAYTSILTHDGAICIIYLVVFQGNHHMTSLGVSTILLLFLNNYLFFVNRLIAMGSFCRVTLICFRDSFWDLISVNTYPPISRLEYYSS